MFSIEENEISDRSIMEATQIAEDVHGRIQFRTTLPSGRPLNSEWIQASDKGKAGVLWAEAVRSQIVGDTQEAAARAKRTLREQRAVAPAKLVTTDGSTLTSAVPPSRIMAPTAPSNASLPVSTQVIQSNPVDADPAVYVRAQYLTAKAQADFWYGERQRADLQYIAAQKTTAKWFGLLQAMGESVEQSQDSSGSNRAVSTADAGSNVVQQVVVSSSQADASTEWEDDDNRSIGR